MKTIKLSKSTRYYILVYCMMVIFVSFVGHIMMWLINNKQWDVISNALLETALAVSIFVLLPALAFAFFNLARLYIK